LIRLGEVQSLFNRAPFLLDLLLQQCDGIDQLLRTRRAAGNVDVHRYDLIDAWHEGVIVEDPARSSTGPHGDDPLRFGHLLPKLADDWRHLVRYATGDD